MNARMNGIILVLVVALCATVVLSVNVGAAPQRVADNSQPYSIVIDKSVTLTGQFDILRFDLLPVVEGRTYSGHIILWVSSEASYEVDVRALVPHVSPSVGDALWTSGVISDILNEDFCGQGLRLGVSFIGLSNPSNIPVLIRGVVQYCNSTNVSTFS